MSRLRPSEVPIERGGESIGAVMGYRTFSFQQGRSSERLFSHPIAKYEWWPNRTSETARCEARRYIGHEGRPCKEVATEHCTCGYHAYYVLEDALENAWAIRVGKSYIPDEVVVALVAGGGNVAHGVTDKGKQFWRSEEMEIVAFHVRDGRECLAEHYLADELGVPHLTSMALAEYAEEWWEKRLEEMR